MGKKGKLSRGKRKIAARNGALSLFVKNKWNGKEPFEEFQKREIRFWNNLPSHFKNPFRKKV